MPGIEKTLMLKELKTKLKGPSLFFTSFDRVPVEKMSQLRMTITKNKCKGVVVKNSVARIMLKEMGMEQATGAITGQVMLIASETEPQKLSKELVTFTKEQESFKINGVFIDGDFRPSTYVAALATLPSREQLIASVVGGIKAPITNFVFCLNSMVRSLVVVLNEVSKKKSA